MKTSFYFFILVAILSACQKEIHDEVTATPSTPSIPKEKKIIFSGYHGNSSTRNYKPCYWVDDQRTDLPLPPGSGYAQTVGIAVNNTDTVVVGYFNQSGAGRKACYWKNRSLFVLPTIASNSTTAKAVKVIDNDVYILGEYTNSNSERFPILWKNGVIVSSPILPVNIPIDLAGIDNKPVIAFMDGVWRNQVFTSWGNTGGMALLLKAESAGNNLLITGARINFGPGGVRGYLWINSSANFRDLTPANCAAFDYPAIKVVGADTLITIYKVGLDNNISYSLWRNGVETALPFDGKTIQVIGTDLYIGGHSKNSSGINKAQYSKNGEVRQLPDEGLASFVTGSAIL